MKESDKHVFKLITGETLFGKMIEENDSYYIFEDPLEIKKTPVMTEEGISYNTTVDRYFNLTESRIFIISKKNIVHIDFANALLEPYLTVLMAKLESKRNPLYVKGNETIN